MLKIPLKTIYRTLTTYRYRITMKRALNILKVGGSMALSRVRRQPIVWGTPLMLMVEPTNICNLKCPMCPSGAGELTRPAGNLTLDRFKQIIDEVGDGLVLILFWNQGEPYLNKNFNQMTAYAKTKNIPVMTSTNGHFLRTMNAVDSVIDSGLDEIIISMDGVDQESYERYRVGGNFQRVIDGMELLSRRKRERNTARPLIHLQFLVMKHNQEKINEIKRLAKRIRVDRLSLKSAQIYTKDQGDHFLPDDERFRRYEDSEGKYRVKMRSENWCRVIWYSLTLNWDGTVVPCCFDKDADFIVGDLAKGEKIKDIWKGEKMQAMRRQILSDRSKIAICANCFEGMSQSYSYFVELAE
ncbi:MAG: hypothetical protein B6244_06725 [Candidatus Cloacimonetes bacterium 4572_55]|nr:MAG: hypothetical protein B6244_06725 [Candidatus Cloacimonetes bacterium 4572_55]